MFLRRRAAPRRDSFLISCKPLLPRLCRFRSSSPCASVHLPWKALRVILFVFFRDELRPRGAAVTLHLCGGGGSMG